MTTTTLCRAKDPSTCRFHGGPVGVQALYEIKRELANFSTVKQFESFAPLKKLNPEHLAREILILSQKNHFNQTKVKSSILLASELHKNDKRANRGNLPSTAYIEHPLRNTVRVLRWGVDREDIILANVLHDTVEDHPKDLVRILVGKKAVPEKEEVVRGMALAALEDKFGSSTARIVSKLSNPILPKYMPSAERNKHYADHVAEAVEEAGVFAAKVSDFVDNAVGLYHNTGASGGMNTEGVKRRARKYLPVCDILFERLHRGDKELNNLIPENGRKMIARSLQDGHTRLKTLSEL